MNINTFKELYSKDDSMKQNFKAFRTWSINKYILYTKNYKLELDDMINKNCVSLSDAGITIDEILSSFHIQYDYISLDTVINIYSELGWELDDKYINAEIEQDEETDVLYYSGSFNELFNKIKDIQDYIEFFYSLLLLINNIEKGRKLFYYTNEVNLGVSKFELTGAMQMILLENKKNVFVAMSFNDNFRSLRRMLDKAISDSGYKPVFIDDKEHNEQIVPEILKEIKDSYFVVADLSGQRGSVYFEAGFALACDKPLILCCDEKEKNDVHFDVAQIKTIFWEDEDDLYRKLRKRIEATIE